MHFCKKNFSSCNFTFMDSKNLHAKTNLLFGFLKLLRIYFLVQIFKILTKKIFYSLILIYGLNKAIIYKLKLLLAELSLKVLKIKVKKPSIIDLISELDLAAYYCLGIIINKYNRKMSVNLSSFDVQAEMTVTNRVIMISKEPKN